MPEERVIEFWAGPADGNQTIVDVPIPEHVTRKGSLYRREPRLDYNKIPVYILSGSNLNSLRRKS